MSEVSDIENTVGWWREAGVDTIVADKPRGWLEAPKAKPGKPVNGQPGETPAIDHGPMPGNLAEFRTWLHDATTSQSTEKPLDAEGDPASGLMIVVDMPEQGDAEAGQLVAGETGLLLDRMLAAIGRDRASIYLATICPARSVGGAIDETRREFLAKAARHHVALAAPRALLCMGDAPSRVFCGANLSEARGSQHNFNHDGGIVPVIATFHPRFLLQQPRFKAQSWKDLQMLIEGLSE
ncbi:MAG: uracil-DNA glycosylase [Sphingomonadaceae bacterium]|nr:uracil-DNA glycosylase [Sphingomonadaceae bacterium]